MQRLVCTHEPCTCIGYSAATDVPDQSEYVSYRGRNKAKVDYQEEVISDDDEYVCKSVYTRYFLGKLRLCKNL